VYVNQQSVTGSDPGNLFDFARQAFPLIVMGAETKPENCFAGGAGLFFAAAGEKAKYTVTAVDKFFNDKITGGDIIVSQMKGFSSLNMTAVDNLDGTYTFDFVRTMSGQYEIDIEVSGTTFYTSGDRKLKVVPSTIDASSRASGVNPTNRHSKPLKP
jgi:hypothetical protein